MKTVKTTADCLFEGDWFIYKGKEYEVIEYDYPGDGRCIITRTDGSCMILLEDTVVYRVE